MFNISSSSVYNYFNAYVNPNRLSLPEIICIDEVFTDIDHNKKYSLVLIDFLTKEPIDIVYSRHKEGIINSFTYIDNRRLSNGPVESFNRKTKDIRRNARGFNNFETLRRRVLWSTRKNEPFKN